MCRNIRTLYNFEPPATRDEINAAALQYVRKVSGYSKPSAVNLKAFNEAVEEIAQLTERLMADLTTNAVPRDRQKVAEANRARSAKRFGLTPD